MCKCKRIGKPTLWFSIKGLEEVFTLYTEKQVKNPITLSKWSNSFACMATLKFFSGQTGVRRLDRKKRNNPKKLTPPPSPDTSITCKTNSKHQSSHWWLIVPFGTRLILKVGAVNICANSPGLSGSHPDTDRISRSSVRSLSFPDNNRRKAHEIHFSDIFWQTFGVFLGNTF